MKICVIKETAEFEQRVAATPETVKKMVNLGATVVVEQQAGIASSFEDQMYQQAGATVLPFSRDLLKDADIILGVQKPHKKALSYLKKGSVFIGTLNPYNDPQKLREYVDHGITTFALEFVPRITRAQAMDVLSSQSNLAGYRAVIEASNVFGKAFPMMMTAAGTIAPAKVLILGAGVAGLQAIATAKRLGAVVSAFDVRAAAKEQVESLGATFIEVTSIESGETKGGYAKEMDEAYKQRQAEKIQEALKKSDIVISTALIPGKPAPVLIPEAMVYGMKPGAVIIDMAVEAGGNCPLSVKNEIVEVQGVKIVGYCNLPSRIAVDASALFSRNIFHFLTLIAGSGKVAIDWQDEIIAATCLTHEGTIVHPTFKTTKE